MQSKHPQRIGAHVYLADDAQLREINHTLIGLRCVIKQKFEEAAPVHPGAGLRTVLPVEVTNAVVLFLQVGLPE
jgi:hypothetical protein